MRAYCRECGSYFCPHVRPELYEGDLAWAVEEWEAASRRRADKQRRLHDEAERRRAA